MSIAFSLMVLSIITVIAFGIAAVGVGNLNFSNQDKYNRQAEMAAEAGIANGATQLLTNQLWTGSGTSTPIMSASPLPNNPNSNYTVTVVNNAKGALGNPDSYSDGASTVIIYPGWVYLMSTGINSNGATTQARRYVKALYEIVNNTGVFQYAAFGDTSMSLAGGAITESYNSDTMHLVGGVPNNVVTSGGNVGTNATNSGADTLSGGATINGTTSIGQGGNTSNITINGGASTTAESVLPSPVAMANVTAPNLPTGTWPSGSTVTPSPGFNYGGQHITGGAVHLRAGNYVFSDLVLSGGGTIVVDSGPINVYITGNTTYSLDLEGGGVTNSTMIAPNLVFWCTYGVTGVKVGGGSAASFGVYAPNASIEIEGGAQIYGSLEGASIHTNGSNSQVIYDNAFLDKKTVPPSLTRILWRRDSD